MDNNYYDEDETPDKRAADKGMFEKLLISFSGGRTSAYMTRWCLQNLKDQYEMIVVFANTGKERPETLDFVNRCDQEFGFNLVWVEADVQVERGKGTRHKIVTYKSASRAGEPFEGMIQKFGLPQAKIPICTRELKQRPIHSYIKKELHWKGYYTAIGIRADEIDRMSVNRKKDRVIYPLIQLKPTRKQDINEWWRKQSFDLNLKSYEGNCDMCFKKSFLKLHTIAKEHPELADWWLKMERKYENYLPAGHSTKLPLRMYRGSASVKQIIEESLHPFVPAKDESNEVYPFKQETLFDLEEFGCAESCEI